MLSSKTKQRLAKKIQINPDTGCWEFVQNITSGGYVNFRPGDGTVRAAHRWMYEYVHNVKLSREQFICHTCDVPHCVNPAHLELGDHKSNMRDRDNKGRNPGNPYGRKGKLTASAIKDIRSSKIPKTQLARKHQVPVTTIYKILKGKLYSKY